MWPLRHLTVSVSVSLRTRPSYAVWKADTAGSKPHVGHKNRRYADACLTSGITKLPPTTLNSDSARPATPVHAFVRPPLNCLCCGTIVWQRFNLADDQVVVERLRRLQNPTGRINDLRRTVGQQSFIAPGDVSTDYIDAIIDSESNIGGSGLCRQVRAFSFLRETVVGGDKQRRRTGRNHAPRRFEISGV